MMITEAETELLRWFRDTYRARTDAVQAGTAPIEWLDEGTRVSWTEIDAKVEQLGIRREPLEMRLWWRQQEILGTR